MKKIILSILSLILFMTLTSCKKDGLNVNIDGKNVLLTSENSEENKTNLLKYLAQERVYTSITMEHRYKQNGVEVNGEAESGNNYFLKLQQEEEFIHEYYEDYDENDKIAQISDYYSFKDDSYRYKHSKGYENDKLIWEDKDAYKLSDFDPFLLTNVNMAKNTINPLLDYLDKFVIIELNDDKIIIERNNFFETRYKTYDDSSLKETITYNSSGDLLEFIAIAKNLTLLINVGTEFESIDSFEVHEKYSYDDVETPVINKDEFTKRD